MHQHIFFKSSNHIDASQDITGTSSLINGKCIIHDLIGEEPHDIVDNECNALYHSS